MKPSSAHLPEWLEAIVVCPACAGELDRLADGYSCDLCSRVYPVRYGIPDFRLDPDPYISVEAEMRKIDGFLADGRSFADLLRAYYVLTPESPPELHSRYMAAMSAAVHRGRGIIRKLQSRFPEAGRETILDVGCGTGGMSIAAAAVYRHVVGVDVALRWLVMGRQRLAEEGVAVPFICANAESLPFRGESFDAVVADAVIEHVRSPEQMRDEALRVLTRGGPFFFTTNNRFSILPEPHVRLWGFGLLPRRWMEPLSWRIRGTPYKARLLSRRSLKRLFRGRGDVLLPYFEPGELGQGNERIRRTWERLSNFAPLRVLLGDIVPQYFIVGRNR